MTAKITSPVMHTNVALSSYGKDSSEVLGVGATLLELDLGMMLNGMGIGEHPAAPNDEPATARAILPLPLPRQREIRLRVDAEHLHHGVHRRHHLHHLLPPHGLHRRGDLHYIPCQLPPRRLRSLRPAVGRPLGPAPPRRGRGRGRVGGIGLGGRLVADAPGLAAPAARRGRGRRRLGLGGVQRRGVGEGRGRRGVVMQVVVVVAGGVGRRRLGLAAALAPGLAAGSVAVAAAGSVAVAVHGAEAWPWLSMEAS